MNEQLWEIVQAQLGYNDEEMALFRKNPKTTGIVSKLPKLMTMKFVSTVVQSHGCAAQHRAGDKLYFDGFGCLIPELSPRRICAFAISSIAQLIWTAQELVYADVDPNEMRLNKVCCIDVGVKCGGLGNVVFEFKAEQSSDEKKT